MRKQILIKKLASIISIALLLVLIQGNIFSQDNNKLNKQDPPNPLTVEQKAQIKNILSKYKASTLTADDAKAIQEKFRIAGIHGGPETKDAIIAAGFDPEKLRTMAPPPAINKNERPKPPSMEERMKIVDDKIINPLAINASQKSVVSIAFKDFYIEMGKLMKTLANPEVPLDKSKIEPLEKARDEKVKKVLTADQFKKYLELEKTTRPPKH